MSLGAVRYLWGDVPGEPSLPQVLLTWRTLEFLPGSIVVGREAVLARFNGAQTIVDWSKSSRIASLVSGIGSVGSPTMEHAR